MAISEGICFGNALPLHVTDTSVHTVSTVVMHTPSPPEPVLLISIQDGETSDFLHLNYENASFVLTYNGIKLTRSASHRTYLPILIHKLVLFRNGHLTVTPAGYIGAFGITLPSLIVDASLYTVSTMIIHPSWYKDYSYSVQDISFSSTLCTSGDRRRNVYKTCPRLTLHTLCHFSLCYGSCYSIHTYTMKCCRIIIPRLR